MHFPTSYTAEMPSIDLPGFARRLRAAREQEGLSLDGLARRVECSKSQVHRLEQGLSVPRADMLLKLSDAVREPVERLLTGRSGEAAEPSPELMSLFLSRPLGASATQAEMHLIRAAAGNAPGEPTLAFLEALLALSRGLISPDEMDSAVATSDAIVAATAAAQAEHFREHGSGGDEWPDLCTQEIALGCDVYGPEGDYQFTLNTRSVRTWEPGDGAFTELETRTISDAPTMSSICQVTLEREGTRISP